MHTLVNEYRLSVEMRKEYDIVKKALKTDIKSFGVSELIFDEFLKSMSISNREISAEIIKIGNKHVFRI